jgi:hypothetical protein
MDEEKIALITGSDLPIYRYITEAVVNWNNFLTEVFGKPGFHVWDVVAAVWITHPHFFDENRGHFESNMEDMQEGLLKINPDPAGHINAPGRILDLDNFWKTVFNSWNNVSVSGRGR